jgi:hypothetical protein
LKSVRSSFGRLTKGQQFQLSKYTHKWTPTLHQLATQDNSINQCCFACRAWQEDIDHVLCCPSDCQAASQDKAKTQFLNHLTKYYTPVPMALVIMAALDPWLANLPPAIVPRLLTGPDKSNQLLHKLIKMLLTNRLTLDGAISYKAVCHSTGKSALQSTTRSVSLEIHITWHYGWQRQRWNMGLLPHNMDCMKWWTVWQHNFAYVSFSVLVCLSVLTMSFSAPCADSAHLPGMLTCPEVLLSLLKKSGKVFIILFPQEFLLRGPQCCGAKFLMMQ